MSFKTIIHCADIHITQSNYKKIRYAWDKLVEYTLQADSPVVVIVGDIFEEKIKYYGTDVDLFIEMLNKLISNAIITVIIPGNHDFNNSNTDLISSIIPRSEYIHYFRDTQNYRMRNIIFQIYSPFDKQIPPAIEPCGEVKVALCHEPITSCQLTERLFMHTGCRLKVDDFSGADIVCLGDIHLPQYLAPNIAYCGSLVQKNRGEPLKHGFISWDIASKQSIFIQLPNYQVDIKYVMCDDVPIKLEDAIDPKSVTLNIINCTKEAVDACKERILRHHFRLDKIFDLTSEVTIKEKKVDPTANITELLAAKLVNNSFKDKVMQLHLKLYTPVSTTRRVWSILSLEWKNICKYAEYSYIDFTKVNGLAVLSGDNAVGKTTIISILTYILFRTSIGKSYILNNGNKENGYIKCRLKVGDSIYCIKRIINRLTSKDVLELSIDDKILENGDITKTYAALENVIGLRENFLSISVASQSRTSFIDKTNIEQLQFITSIIGINDMNELSDVVKKQMLGIKKAIEAVKGITLPVIIGTLEERQAKIDAYTSELAILESTYKDTSEQIIQLSGQLHQLNVKGDLSREALDNAEMQLKQLNIRNNPVDLSYIDELRNLIQMIIQLNEKFKDRAKSNSIELVELTEDYIRNAIDKLTAIKFKVNLRKVNLVDKVSIQVHSELIQLTPAELLEASKSVAHAPPAEACEDPKYDINALQTEINIAKKSLQVVKDATALIKKLKRLESSEIETTAQLLYQDLDKYNIVLKKISSAQKTVGVDITNIAKSEKWCISETISDAEYNQFVDQLDHIARMPGIEMKYADACECCQQNKQSFIKIYAAYKTLYCLAAAVETYIANRIQIINDNLEIMSIKEELKKISKNKEVMTTIESYKSQIDAQLLYDRYLSYVKYTRYKLAELLIENSKNEKELLYLSSMYNVKDVFINHLKQLEAINNYNIALSAYNKAVEASEMISHNKRINDQINNLKATSIQLKNRISEIRDNLTTAKLELERFIADTENIKNISDKKNMLEEDLSIHSLYLASISPKTGLTAEIIAAKISFIENEWNAKLAIVSDFQVHLEMDEKQICVSIMENDKYVSVDAASGYQKFILDLTFRYVLHLIANVSMPDFLMIDEGFGAADSQNRFRLKEYLTSIARDYPFILVISHLDDFHMIANTTLQINTSDVGSVIRYGEFENTIEVLEGKSRKTKKGDLVAEITNRTNEEYNTLNTYDGHTEGSIIELQQNLTYRCRCCDKILQSRQTMQKHLVAKTHIIKLADYINTSGDV